VSPAYTQRRYLSGWLLHLQFGPFEVDKRHPDYPIGELIHLHISLIIAFSRSVLVSSREADGNAHAAMQRLVRNLNERHYHKEMGGAYRRKQMKRANWKTEDASEEPLALTGLDAVSARIQACLLKLCKVSEGCRVAYRATKPES